MRIRLLTLILAGATGSFSPPAIGAETAAPVAGVARAATPTHVIGFVAGDHFDEAEALSRAVKKAVELSTNQRLGTGDFSIEVLTAALGCKERPEPSCLKKIANKISSQRFLWGTLSVEGQRIRVELHLYSDDATDKKVSFSYQPTAPDTLDGDLISIAANSISQLMGPLRYRTTVHSKQKTGAVWVDGNDAGQLVNGELALELAAGDHEFQLRGKRGSKPLPNQANGQKQGSGEESPSDAVQTLAALSTRVQVADQTKVRLDPESQPEPPPSKPPPVAVPTKVELSRSTPEAFVEDEASSGSPQRTWGYIGLSAGGALLVGGAAAAASLYLLNHKEGFQRYREGLLPSENACDEAKRNRSVTGAMQADDVRSLCKRASVLEIAEVVLFSTGVVAAGTGLTLILTSKSTPAASAQVLVPTVSVRRGYTDIGVEWHF